VAQHPQHVGDAGESRVVDADERNRAVRIRAGSDDQGVGDDGAEGNGRDGEGGEACAPC